MLFEDIIYPITEYRQELLVLEWIVVFFALEWTFIFFLRIRKQRKKLERSQEDAYVWLFLGYAIMWSFTIIADFYAETSEIRVFFLYISYFIATIGLLLFIINMERVSVHIRPFFFSKLFTTLSLSFIVIVIFLPETAYTAYRALWVIFLIFWAIVLRDLSSSSTRSYKKNGFNLLYAKFFTTFGFMVLGFALTTEDSVKFFGMEARLLGDSFQMLGIFLVSIFFIFSIPSLTDFTWKNRVESIFITHKSGLFIFKKQLRETEDPIDETIIAGELTTLKMMLERITKRKGGMVIKKSGKTLLIYPGQFITGIIICDKSLRSLKTVLKNLIVRIETIYSAVLTNWKGDTKVFSPIGDIVKDIFD